MTMLRTQYTDLYLGDMLPALDRLIDDARDEFPEQYSQIFNVTDMTGSILQDTGISGAGKFVETPEGVAVSYDQLYQMYDKTYTPTQWSLGIRISKLAIDDGKWNLVQKSVKALGRSSRRTVEEEAAKLFINGFASGTGPDGVYLFSASHPTQTGTASNLLTAADLDVAPLEAGLTQARKATGFRGEKLRIPITNLVIPPDLEFMAVELLASAKRYDSLNAVNAFSQRPGMNSLSNIVVWEYLTDTDAWFLTADKSNHEARFLWRERFNTSRSVNDQTRTAEVAGWMRFTWGWSGWYGLYGNLGA